MGPRAPTARALTALGIAAAVASVGACSGADRGASLADLDTELREVISSSGAEVGLYYRSLGPAADSVLVNPDLRMHAASTMKVPVMMQLFLDDQSGVRPLEGDLEVTTTFHSIVDDSDFVLPKDSDSDSTLYERVGERVPLRELIELMITKSSNLATNMLIELADARRVTALLRDMGADSMEVLRGVEDLKAFRAGMSNTTTARDLGVVMRMVATSDRFTDASRAEMITILERQHFRENIPAGLPAGTRVANKTGWINGIDHDAAIVFPEGAPPFVLVVMIRGEIADEHGAELAARLSRIVWNYHVGREVGR